MSALDFNAVVNDFAAAQRAVVSSAAKEPTLLQLAQAAISAAEVEQSYEWQGPGDANDIRLWHARCDARDIFFAALAEQTGICRTMFDRLGEL